MLPAQEITGLTAAEDTAAEDTRISPDEKGEAPVQVIHIDHSIDFSDDEAEPDEELPKEEQKPDVRFVKGGQFDD